MCSFSVGLRKLLIRRVALCFPDSKEVSRIIQEKRTFSGNVQSNLPFLNRPSENMLIRANTDGTYSANWTPGAVGLYTIHVTIDGIEIGK